MKKIKLISFITTLLLFMFLAPNSNADENSEAKVVYDSGINLNVILKSTGKRMSVKDQTYSMRTYTLPLTKNFKNIPIGQKYAINNFIVYGTASTNNLSAKERFNLVKAYITKQKKLPKIKEDWLSILKKPSVIPKPVAASSPTTFDIPVNYPNNNTTQSAGNQSNNQTSTVDTDVLGPYSSVGEIVNSGENFGFTYNDSSGKSFININDNISKQSQEVGALRLSGTKFAYHFSKNNSYYANIDSQEFGPYNDMTMVSYADGHYIFGYKDGATWKINNNGTVISDAGSVLSVDIFGNNFGYIASNNLNLNGQMMGACLGYAQIVIGPNAYAYSCYKTGGFMININGTEYGPYASPEILKVTGKSYAFTYGGGQKSININGQTFGPYQKILSVALTDNNYGYIYANNSNIYANINGKISEPIGKYGDMGGNGIWTIAISNQKYYYDYQKDGQWYVKRGMIK
ncbi:MAG: hypothetical protein ACOYMB_02370 [Patescibacteria group bacterium]